MILSQAIIFVLGWPLEWTEIIVIFVPIFLPLLKHFNIDPILWGTLVFVNLQAAFLSPPVAMSAFYLKGVSPPHVTLNQIFAGMMPYMLIVILCMVIMYVWPGMTLWLPNYLYGRAADPAHDCRSRRCGVACSTGVTSLAASTRATRGGRHARQRNPAHQGQHAVHDDARRRRCSMRSKVMAQHDIGSLVVMDHGQHGGPAHLRRSAARAGASATARSATSRSPTSASAIR